MRQNENQMMFIEIQNNNDWTTWTWKTFKAHIWNEFEFNLLKNFIKSSRYIALKLYSYAGAQKKNIKIQSTI